MNDAHSIVISEDIADKYFNGTDVIGRQVLLKDDGSAEKAYVVTGVMRAIPGMKSSGLRTSLVVLQFALSTTLIIGTLVIYRQLDYIGEKDLGFERQHMLVIKNLHVQDFAYRTNIPVWIMVLAGLTAIIVAVLAIGYQSVRAARVNPAESLRTE